MKRPGWGCDTGLELLWNLKVWTRDDDELQGGLIVWVVKQLGYWVKRIAVKFKFCIVSLMDEDLSSIFFLNKMLCLIFLALVRSDTFEQTIWSSWGHTGLYVGVNWVFVWSISLGNFIFLCQVIHQFDFLFVEMCPQCVCMCVDMNVSLWFTLLLFKSLQCMSVTTCCYSCFPERWWSS